jgi:tetratricopeptide (TPR) repeat protein
MLFVMQLCVAQQKELDSLQNLLGNHPTEDTIRLNLLLKISYYYYFINPDTGLEKADQAIALAQKLNIESKLARAFNNKANNYLSKGEDTLGLSYYNKSLDIWKKNHDSAGIADLLYDIGIVYYNFSDYAKALQYQKQSQEIYEHLRENEGIAATTNSIGLIYRSISNFSGALENYFKALRIYEKSGNVPMMASEFTNIGNIYNNLADYTKALEYHFKALSIYEQRGDKNGTQRALNNIGNCYDDNNKPEKALIYYQQALDIAQSANFKHDAAIALENIGIVYRKLTDYTKALKYLRRALELDQQLGGKSNVAQVSNEIGQAIRDAPAGALKQIGIKPQNKYDTALEYFNSALQNATENGEPDMQAEVWHQLSITYEEQKQYSKALEAYKKYSVLYDSVTNSQNSKKILHAEMQFEYDNKETLLIAQQDKQKALIMAEINRQRIVRNAVTWGAAVLLLAAITSFVFYKKNRDTRAEKADAEFEAQLVGTEMKALRAQMNPHFIFNSLNSISDYIAKNNIRAADEYLTKFARLMRTILENSEQKEVSLASDLKALELYMQLESQRLNNKFTWEIKTDEDVDPENTLIPPLILQPFVENSIWHGLAKKPGHGKIVIQIKREGEMINCIVEDNGVGRENAESKPILDSKKEKKSLGMKITSSRIDIINKTKKANATINISDLDEGTRVEVKLPLQLIY